MLLSEEDVQKMAVPGKDGLTSTAVVRLRKGDAVFTPGCPDEVIKGPMVVEYTFSPFGVSASALGPWELPLWALKIAKKVRWWLHL